MSGPSATPELLAKLVKWYEDFETETRDYRKLAEKDRDFYDGKQWSDQEVATLQKRNQPVVTYNRIAPKINHIRGYEVQTRIDPKGLPRNPADEDAAIAITDSLRFVADTEKFDKVRSAVAEWMMIEGYGGAIVEPEEVSTEKPIDSSVEAAPGLISETEVSLVERRFEIRLRKAPWDRLFYDPHSSEPDFSDAKYLGVVQWWHLDDAIAEPDYADKADELEAAVDKPMGSHSDETHDDRPRQMWTKTEPERVKICEIYWREGGCWYVAHFTKSAFLVEPRKVALVDEDGKTYCPLLMASSFVDRENARYGIVRSMISAQEEINKRRSKALHLVNFRQIVYESNAFPQPEQARSEFAKPDGMVEVNRDVLSEKRLEIGNTTDMLQGQLQLLQDAKLEIDATGPEAPLVGEDRRVQSGAALQFRSQVGIMQLEPVFDHLRDWQTRVFTAIWWQIRQFWTDERWIRVTDDSEKRGFRFVGLNQKMTRAERLKGLLGKQVPLAQALDSLGIPWVEWQPLFMQAQQAVQAQLQQAQQQGAQIDPKQSEQMVAGMILQHPMMAEQFVANEIGRIGCDVMIDAAPDTTVLQQAEFADLVEVARSMPGSIPPAVIIQASQLRNKKELVAMMQKQDPTQEQLKQLSVGQAQAEIEKTKAQAADEQASAQQRLGHAQSMQADVPLKQAKSMKAAAEAGEKSVPPMMGPGQGVLR